MAKLIKEICKMDTIQQGHYCPVINYNKPDFYIDLPCKKCPVYNDWKNGKFNKFYEAANVR